MTPQIEKNKTVTTSEKSLGTTTLKWHFLSFPQSMKTFTATVDQI